MKKIYLAGEFATTDLVLVCVNCGEISYISRNTVISKCKVCINSEFILKSNS